MSYEQPATPSSEIPLIPPNERGMQPPPNRLLEPVDKASIDRAYAELESAGAYASDGVGAGSNSSSTVSGTKSASPGGRFA